MDPILAELYGTDELVKEAAGVEEEVSIEEYLEKEAADSFAEWATESGIDLEKEADEDVTATYAEFRDGFMKAAAEELGAEGTEEYTEETGEEKLAEADFLGRVMAHSYVSELAEIEKEAAGGGKVRQALGKYWRALRGTDVKKIQKELGQFGDTPMAEQLKQRAWEGKYQKAFQKHMGEMSATRGAKGRARAAALKEVGAKPTFTGTGVRGRELEEAVKARRLARGVTGGVAGGLGVAGAGGAGIGYMAGKEKKSADEEYAELVQDRALEILKEAGYAEEPETYDEEKLAYAIEYDALSTLEEMGYPVEWAE